MFRQRTGWLTTASALALFLLPALASAEVVVFKNDTAVPVTVYAACVINGKVVNARPVQVQPNDSAKIDLPGNKIIIIRDAKGNQKFYEGILPGAAQDQYISMQPDGNKPKVKLEPGKPPP